MTIVSDWANRWLGGFCAVGALGGLPVRGPDYAAHPPLRDQLTLPPVYDLARCDNTSVQAAWSDALGGAPVVLLRSVEGARAVVLRALGVQAGEPVGLPANATRDLTEAVKHHPAQPRWLDLNAQLELSVPACSWDGVRVAWAQPCGGAWTSAVPAGIALVIDAGDSLPDPERSQASGADVTIYGLHLSADPRHAGALIVCGNPALALALTACAAADAPPDAGLALLQLQRIVGQDGLAARQGAALRVMREGLEQAAGLPLLNPAPGVLPHAIAVYVPEPCDPATFYAYVLGEQTPVCWLPALRPLHYAAIRADGGPGAHATAAHLARVLLVPVGPNYSEEEVKHAVLGITKAADYLGVRWIVDPARAAWYAQQMLEWYGPNHDGYRLLRSFNAEPAGKRL
ncbi:MAG: hypothetical protein HC828_00565 [Blastochloris sp.]|nr:hypothetical protein [Blastochloris sp.]